MAFDIDMIRAVYERMPGRIAQAREAVGKPLTLAEKILYNHLWQGNATESYTRGGSYVDFAPDRVAMQDATAQMALLQFMQAGKAKAAVPSTVHCDHLIQARIGADKDLQAAINGNNEVFNFLESVSNKYGVGFWKPGAGIFERIRRPPHAIVHLMVRKRLQGLKRILKDGKLVFELDNFGLQLIPVYENIEHEAGTSTSSNRAKIGGGLAKNGGGYPFVFTASVALWRCRMLLSLCMSAFLRATAR